MSIRAENAGDIKAIEEVTLAAFTAPPRSNPTEHLIVNSLREEGLLTLSLVAEQDGKVVGHVAFSPVLIDGKDGAWLGLGPISVLPSSQKQGFGSALIKAGLSKIREMGAKGCVVEGNPAYYQRFGFKPFESLVHEQALDPKYFMALPFYEEIPEGKVKYHESFYIQV